MKKLVASFLVVCLVFAGLWVLPVVGEEEDSQASSQNSSRGARGNTLYVGSGQTYAKIQDAVNASQDGDTVRVFAGLYYENVVIDKTISLIGNGSSKSIVNGSFTGSTITILANWCNVSGLYVTGSGKTWWSEDSGIILIGVENCSITYSNCSENSNGIYLKYSNRTNIQYCHGYANTWNFINLTYSNNNYIANNSCIWCKYGFVLLWSYNNIFENNWINDSSRGLEIHSGIKNRFFFNTFWKNYNRGAYIFSNNNIFYYNNFIYCKKGGNQALDWGNNNIWNSTSQQKGNYWSDWTTPDSNSDGIVDLPYNIDGGKGAKDYYPLTNPTRFVGSPPVIQTSNVEIAYVDEYYTVTYTAYDPDTSNSELTWKTTSNASWLNISASQRWLAGTPTNLEIGTYWVNVSVADYTNLVYTNFTLTVKNRTGSSSGNGTAIIVRTGEKFTKIQDAINASWYGDTIRVWSGEFQENLVISKSLSLIGNGSGNTTINATGKGSGIIINDDYCNITGFRICESKILGNWADSGLQLNSDYNNIWDCELNGNEQGIYLTNSNNNKISNCTLINNKWGDINLTLSNNNEISNCSIDSFGSTGIILSISDNSYIAYNRFVNLYGGLRFHNSHFNKVQYNSIEKCHYSAITLFSHSSNNYFHLNNFIDNQLWDDDDDDPQAFDFTSNNSWNGSSEGNYWSDWTSPDNNSDGIVDIPYNITGEANAKDYYPLVKPVSGIPTPPNKPPKIVTTDIETAYVGKIYSVNYSATDPDTPQTNLTWSMNTNASWLTFSSSQELSGTPLESDIGTYWVNISVADGENIDSTNFTLTVLSQSSPFQPGKGSVIIVRTGQRFTKIQDAINKAISGDTIRVWAGVYYENIILKKSLSIIGNGSQNTIIDGNSSGTVIKIESNWCNISNLQIRNSTMEGINYNWLYTGIHILGQYNYITHCHFESNINHGINIENSKNNLIENCSFSKNNIGINIINSEKNQIRFCDSNKNWWSGINISNSDKNGIYHCKSSHNDNGIYMHDSKNNIIYNNILKSNNFGIESWYSSNNTISMNLLENNSRGIELKYCDSNLIYYNTFLGSLISGPQASDNQRKNSWNTSSQGNYWSDWTSPDKNNDGIVDFPYNLSGGAGAKDYYPLTKAPALTTPSPVITTKNVLTAYVGKVYSVNYSATDQDTPQNNLTWIIITNASWLNLSSKQELSGTPTKSDIGTYLVYIEVSDGTNSDWTNFTLTVMDEQVKPEEKKTVIKKINIEGNSNNVSINTSQIVIEFSQPMNRTSVEAALKITPHVNYTLVWEKNNTVLKIVFLENLSYDTKYSITIGTSAKAYDGTALDKPFEIIFTTEHRISKEHLPSIDDDEWGIVIILAIVSVITLILIFLIFLSFILKNRRKYDDDTQRVRYEHESEGITVTNGLDEEIYELKKSVLGPEKPSDFGLSKQEMINKFKKKYEKGGISKETFEVIEKSLKNK